MCFSSSDIAKMWAGKLAESEARAFEKALKRAKDMTPVQYIRSDDYPDEVNDEVEQAYRQGWHDGFKCCNDKMVSKLMNENAELRDMIKVQSEQILRLRECINRNHEDFYE